MSSYVLRRPFLPAWLALAAAVSACDRPPVPGASTADSVPQTPVTATVVPIAPEGKWIGAGRTERGTAVYVDTTSVRDSADARLGTFRIKHPTPFTADSGRKSFVMSDADVIVICGMPSKSVARHVRHYADLDGTQVVSDREDTRAPWNVESPGTFGDVSVAYLCPPAATRAK
ncbi:MAG: hypothetical protein MUE41_04535 [Gemmatimonadaceae bacterium]|jgi:hypothetical protein|nr:hypothetical protein [Gemmatimonadaceae bacterium]